MKTTRKNTQEWKIPKKGSGNKNLHVKKPRNDRNKKTDIKFKKYTTLHIKKLYNEKNKETNLKFENYTSPNP